MIHPNTFLDKKGPPSVALLLVLVYMIARLVKQTQSLHLQLGNLYRYVDGAVHTERLRERQA